MAQLREQRPKGLFIVEEAVYLKPMEYFKSVFA
jgi:hypothetical protein